MTWARHRHNQSWQKEETKNFYQDRNREESHEDEEKTRNKSNQDEWLLSISWMLFIYIIKRIVNRRKKHEW
jgi:hypothetical protein